MIPREEADHMTTTKHPAQAFAAKINAASFQ